MRKFTDGSGADSTATATAYLASSANLVMFTLVKIQFARWLSDPNSGASSYLTNPILLTDCPAAIKYTPIGTFRTAAIKHGSMPFGIGVDFNGFDLAWSPGPNDIVIPAGSGAFGPPNPQPPALSIFAGVLAGIFDGAYISVYKVLMPPFGNPPVYDANTYGVCLLHTGMVDEITVDGGEVQFKVGSIIDQQNQQIPSQLIGPNSRFASVDPLAYASSSARNSGPGGPSSYTLFAERGSCTPSRIVTFFNGFGINQPPTGFFDGGFVTWVNGPLLGMRRAVAHSISTITAGGPPEYITFELAHPYPYEANAFSAGYLIGFELDAYSLRNPQTTDPLYNGFPYVPAPEDAF